MHKTVTIMIAVLLGVSLLIWFSRPMSVKLLHYLSWRYFSGVETSVGTVKNADATVHYRSFGKGPPLILLRGGLSSGLDWFSQLPRLSNRFQTIVIDLRGHGRSTIGSKPFSYNLFARDVVQVLDALEIDQADLIGWSDGGNVGLLLARFYPERMNRLILISANFQPSGLTEEATDELKKATVESAGHFKQWLFKWFSPEPGRWKELWTKVTMMWKQYPQLSEADLRSIQSPVLLVVGANDMVEIAHAKQMTEWIPGARLEILADTGHAVLREAPDRVLQLIWNFFCPKDNCR